MLILAVNVLAVNVSLPPPVSIVSKRVLYTLQSVYSVKKCLIHALRAFLGGEGGGDGSEFGDDGLAQSRARRGEEAESPGGPSSGEGHGERSRLQLLFS